MNIIRVIRQLIRNCLNYNITTNYAREENVIYRVSLKLSYKRSDGDCTYKNKSKKENNIFLFKSFFSRKINFEIRQVLVC